MDWQPIDSAPFNEDLEIAFIDNGEAHYLVFPCRRTSAGWVNGKTGKLVVVHPSHWRRWEERGSR